MHKLAQTIAVSATLALIIVIAVWELGGTPLQPGGSWMVLKALPLLLALRGLMHGRRYTFQWMSLLSLGYVVEGVVRAWAETHPSRSFALAELVLAVAIFGAAIGYSRVSAPSRALS